MTLLIVCKWCAQNFAEDLDVGDYLKEGDKGFKKFKVKKGKKRTGRARTDAELADGDDMAVDAPAPIERNLDMNFVDDDELQAALARERRAKLRKSNKLTPEELAKKGRYGHLTMFYCAHRYPQLPRKKKRRRRLSSIS